jgi:YD repeat-containing protein
MTVTRRQAGHAAWWKSGRSATARLAVVALLAGSGLLATVLPADGGLPAGGVSSTDSQVSLDGETAADVSAGLSMAVMPGSGVEPAAADESAAAAAAVAVAVTYGYDEPTGRLVSTSTVPELKQEALDVTYSYDPAGNVIRVADAPGVSMPNDTQCFRYGHQRRLTDAWTPTSPMPFNCNAAPHLTSIGGVAPYRLRYAYDVTGNRTAEDTYGAGTGGGTWQQSTAYNYPPPGTPQAHAVNEATITTLDGFAQHTYGYDQGGHLTERTLSASTQDLTWSPEGHIESIDDSVEGLTEYVYDADGNRLIRRDPRGTTLYLGSQELRYDNTTQMPLTLCQSGMDYKQRKPRLVVAAARPGPIPLVGCRLSRRCRMVWQRQNFDADHSELSR